MTWHVEYTSAARKELRKMGRVNAARILDWMDKHNQVCADDDPYTVRLKKLTEGLNEVEGIPLNFQGILCD